MGVANRSCGGAGRPAGRSSGGRSETFDCPFGGLTGFALGEGGIPRVRRGARGLLLFRDPGTGGLRSGAGDDIVRLLCPCRGKLESFGAATAVDCCPFHLVENQHDGRYIVRRTAAEG